MTFKNLNKTNTSLTLSPFETKLLNDSVYSSSYVKELHLGNKQIVSKLESYNSIDNASLVNKAHIGFSLPNKRLTFTSVLNKSLKFKLRTFHSTFNLIEADVYNLEKTIKSIKSVNNEYKTLMVLNTVKGGFKVYYFGLIGFLPRSQALYFFKAYLQTIKSFIKQININTFILINYSSLFMIVPKQIFKVSSINRTKVSFYSYSLKKFSFFKKKKLFYNNFSMIFLLKS